MDDVPEFEKRPHRKVMTFTTSIFGKNLIDLRPFDNGSFRVIFKSGMFTLAEEQGEPSHSQWSTLKKRLKRHDRSTFVFKEHGHIECPTPSEGEACYYLDFGFFKFT